MTHKWTERATGMIDLSRGKCIDCDSPRSSMPGIINNKAKSMETRKMNAPRAMYLASISASIHESLPSPPPLHLHSILPLARCRCHRMHAVSSSAHPAALSTMPPPFPRPSNGGLHAWILKRGQLAVGEGLSEEEGGRPGTRRLRGWWWGCLGYDWLSDGG